MGFSSVLDASCFFAGTIGRTDEHDRPCFLRVLAWEDQTASTCSIEADFHSYEVYGSMKMHLGLIRMFLPTRPEP